MKRIIVAVTGASGTLYALRFLRFLVKSWIEVDLIMSDAAKITAKAEIDVDFDKVPMDRYLAERYPDDCRNGRIRSFDVHAIAAPIASGSVRRQAMVVIPCSMKTLAGLAHGASSNLIERSADVMLKENLPLVVVPRETPLNVIQLENMVTLARAGARIVPAMPAFYHRPQTLDDIADFIAGRVAQLLGLDDHGLFRPWSS